MPISSRNCNYTAVKACDPRSLWKSHSRHFRQKFPRNFVLIKCIPQNSVQYGGDGPLDFDKWGCGKIKCSVEALCWLCIQFDHKLGPHNMSLSWFVSSKFIQIIKLETWNEVTVYSLQFPQYRWILTLQHAELRMLPCLESCQGPRTFIHLKRDRAFL